MDLLLEAVSAGYGPVPVMAEVSLTIPAGQVTVLLGPNGCGKTTLLKSVTGTARLLSGSIRLGVEDLSALGVRARAQRVSYVPQSESPTAEYTVGETVLMGRMPWAVGFRETAEDLRAAEEAMARTECLAWNERLVGSLSAGEMQRVWIARSLAQATPVLLMDEPTSNADLGHTMDIGEMVRTLAQEGKTVLIATHDLNWAARYADRVVALRSGAVVGECAPDGIRPLAEQVFAVRIDSAVAPSGAVVFAPRERL
ncbi:MAG: ABC transporter ATP-binding protein [Chthonomonas sp.]|nr:ABC transporter ATP-binding protein [Chthonomonas sp.]